MRNLLSAPPVASGSNGGWTLFSVDSGVIVIHAVPLSNGQVFFMERPGNRELPVRHLIFLNTLIGLIFLLEIVAPLGWP